MGNDERRMTIDELFEKFQSKIYEIVDYMNFGVSDEEMNTIRYFISNCSISDFEKLKEMDYDISTAKTESDDTAQ